jgi:predicted lipid carrier protein YhbT/chorismate mutase
MTQATAAASLARTRILIDLVDDSLLLLLAARRQLALAAARRKRNACLPPGDAAREQQVQLRAARLAQRLGIPGNTARALMTLAISDARRSQGLPPDVDQGGAAPVHDIIAPHMSTPHSQHSPGTTETGSRWLRLLPPPARWALVLRACPPACQRRLLERTMAQVLSSPLANGALDFLQDRRLGIEVADLHLRWVVTLRHGRLLAIDGPAEASVRGSATDLLLLASRLEDADTLFFQRRLVLTGDTELGLTARNLLDRLPWEQVPLAVRILLNRGARLAQAARTVYRTDG